MSTQKMKLLILFFSMLISNNLIAMQQKMVQTQHAIPPQSLSSQQSVQSDLLPLPKPLKYADKENNVYYSLIKAKNKPLLKHYLSEHCTSRKVVESMSEEQSSTKDFLLEEIDADVKFKNVRKETLIHVAVSCGHNGILKMLLGMVGNSVDLNARNHNGDTAVHYAVFRGNKKGLKLLKKYGADLDLQNHDGITPFVQALQLGKHDFAYSLLRDGASAVSQDAHLHQPLHFTKSAIMVKHLVAQGANPNAQGNFGYTPLVFAVKYDRQAVFTSLVAAGALLNCVDDSGRNLACFSCKQGPIHTKLQQAGITQNVKNQKLVKPRKFTYELLLDDRRTYQDDSACVII